MNQAEKFWWNDITGPKNVIKGVAESLSARSMVVLKVPSDLPWRHQMRSDVENQFRMMSREDETIVKMVDAIDDCAGAPDIGRFLLERYASSVVERGYREKSGTIQDYMIQNQVLKNTIIWVKALDAKAAEQWIKFCRGYRTRAVSDGLFVLEVHGDIAVAESKSIKVIDFEHLVRDYDVQLFNSFVLDEKERTFGDIKKRYIASLAAHLCKTDAEISGFYLEECNPLEEDPLTGIAKAAQAYDRRGVDKDSEHVLALWRYQNEKELNHRIWKAQLEVLFPIIEMKRVEFIQKHYKEIRTCLAENVVEQFKTQLTEPMDVELGTLGYMMAKKEETGERLLYIPDEEERRAIYCLRDYRNLLAHGNCCSVEQVKDMLEN